MRRQSKGIPAAAFFYGASFHGNLAFQPKEPVMTESHARALAADTQQDLERQLALSLFIQRPDVQAFDRGGHWIATFDNYDGPGSSLGYGPTRESAIAELFDDLWDAGKL